MGEKIKAVMIYNQCEPSEALNQVLKRLGLEVRRLRTCHEASGIFQQTDAAELVFTDTNLPDGTWEDVVQLAQQGNAFLPVIVVSRMVDIDLYLEALERGAFDFVAPPFLSHDLANVTGSAMYQKLVSRASQVMHVA